MADTCVFNFENQTPATDLIFVNHGSIFLMRAETERGDEWIVEHIPEDHQEFNGSIVIEHRYARDVFFGACEDGLRCEMTTVGA